MEIYYEQSVSGSWSTGRNALYVLCCVLTALALLAAVMFGANVLEPDPNAIQINWLSAAGLVLSLLAAGFIFLRKDYLRMEYDYILRGDVLEIYAILNRRRRRKLAALNLKHMHAVGLAISARCASLKKQRGIRMHSWFTMHATHYIYYIETNVRHMALLQLDDQMAALIHRQLGVGVWQSIEGK